VVVPHVGILELARLIVAAIVRVVVVGRNFHRSARTTFVERPDIRYQENGRHKYEGECENSEAEGKVGVVIVGKLGKPYHHRNDAQGHYDHAHDADEGGDGHVPELLYEHVQEAQHERSNDEDQDNTFQGLGRSERVVFIGFRYTAGRTARGLRTGLVLPQADVHLYQVYGCLGRHPVVRCHGNDLHDERHEDTRQGDLGVRRSTPAHGRSNLSVSSEQIQTDVKL